MKLAETKTANVQHEKGRQGICYVGFFQQRSMAPLQASEEPASTL